MEINPMLFLSSPTKQLLTELFLSVYIQNKHQVQTRIHEILSLIARDTGIQSACLVYVIYVDFNRYYGSWLQLQGCVDKSLRLSKNKLLESCIDRRVVERELISFIERYVYG